MSSISVVIPVFYNAESLPLLFEDLLGIEKALSAKRLELQLIFVDDGSRDNSLAELLKIKQQRPSTRVIKLTRNFGAVHACKTGLPFVTGDCFMILAADLQDPPDLILQMVDKWQAGCKYVVAARQNRDDPLLSKAFSYVYYRLLRRFVISDYPRGGYDMALMDKQFLPHMTHSSKNTYTPLLAFWLGFEPFIVPYKRRARIHGASRWSYSKKLTAAIDAIFGFSFLPIRFVSLVGLLVSILSFAYAAWIVINALLGRMDVRGFATIVALVAFMQGLGIFMLGIIGEYIWRILDEVNQRPESVIDTIY
jgi:dolichol-phosphate mannosyltransferase